MGTPYPTPIDPTRTRIGWIGIGVMGGAMAARLLAAGYSLTIYARDPSKAQTLQTLGANLADSPSSLAQSSDVVFTMLSAPSDVRSVVLRRPDSLLAGLNPNSVTVDMTSSDPSLAAEIFAASRRKDCWSVDAPVSGGDVGAKDGKLAIFAGGDENVVKWLGAIWEVLGRVSYMGEAGKGQKCKIANQINIGCNMVGLSEGLVFAERAGLDLGVFLGAIKNGSAYTKALELFGERMVEGDFRPGGFAEYMVKDLGMGVNVVEEREDGEVVVLPHASLCKQLFSSMVANGDGKLGGQAIISAIKRINGL